MEVCENQTFVIGHGMQEVEEQDQQSSTSARPGPKPEAAWIEGKTKGEKYINTRRQTTDEISPRPRPRPIMSLFPRYNRS